MGKITDKRQVFIEQYIICGFNATEAARRAGYANPNMEGTRLRQDPDVKELIDSRIKEMQITADEVVTLLSQQAKSEHSSYITEDGEVDIKKMVQDGKAHLIKEVTEGKRGKTYKFADSQAALALLAKYFGLTQDKVEHSGKVELDINSESIRAEIEAKLSGAIRKTEK